MSNVEYKTIALPRSVAARRRRRQSEADLVAEQLGKVLNEEATDGWEYVRAETLTTPGRNGMFQKGNPSAYVVLIFRRDRSVVWRPDETPAHQARQAEAQAPAPEPVPAPAPIAPVAPVAPAPAPQAAPAAQPEVRFASTSVQLVSTGEHGGTVTPMRPLGSAQD